MFESPWHWAVVAVVAFILFFGWKNLPDMSRSLGRSLRIFKTEIKGMGQDDKERAEAEAPKAIDPPPPAQVVKNPAARPAAGAPAPARPRPTPRPTAHSAASGDSAER